VAAAAERALEAAVIAAVADDVAPSRTQLRRLAAALDTNPELLTSGEPDGPRLLQALIAALLQAGATRVRAAACARCRRSRPLRRRVEGRLMCESCANAVNVQQAPCTRCGRHRRVDGRDGAGQPLCRACVTHQRGADPLDALVEHLVGLETGSSAVLASVSRHMDM
jgi:hypothetical protein